MKTVIINLSPRSQGTSSMLTKYFKERIENFDTKNNEVTIADLYQNLKDIRELLDSIKAADTLVFIGPCYVVSYPADTIYLLEQMSETEGVLHGQKLYGFIQGGMPYVHTHEIGLKLLDIFSDENDVKWMGGYVMGGGAVLDGRPLDKAIGANKIIPAVHQFIKNIAMGVESPEELYKAAAMKVPYPLAVILSRLMTARIKKLYREKGINYKVPSPYLK